MARPDFRAVAARRLSEERELSPSIVSLLSAEGSAGASASATSRSTGSSRTPRTRASCSRSRRSRSWLRRSASTASSSRSSSARRAATSTSSSPASVAGAPRAWPGCSTVPALVEELDDDAALEIAVIENLQREDLSPLEEATMYEKMVTEHGYSIRKLAQKLGKDKGYLENRLRLADAPEEIRALVSVRKDTLSHAYELMKVQDPKKRKRLAAQVASGQLSLVKLRERIEGRPRRAVDRGRRAGAGRRLAGRGRGGRGALPPPATVPTGDDALLTAKAQFQEALGGAAGRPPQRGVRARPANPTDRQNLAKYLTISKLTIENAITVVRGRGD